MATMKKRQEAEARSIAEQAAEWLLILEDGKPEDRAAFADWLLRSPLHVGAFLRATAIDELASEVDPERTFSLDPGPFPELVEVGKEADAEPKDWLRRFGAVRFALAASVVLTFVALAAIVAIREVSEDPWKHYSADVGEQRVLRLVDGSVMYLEPGSAVDVRFLKKERSLKLIGGGAIFKVAHDKSKPFRVYSGDAVVQAVGTQFSVNRLRNDSVVTVVEGVVQVSRDRSLAERLQISTAEVTPVRLAAGQEARIAPDGQISKPKPAAADPVQSWAEKRLTFVNETLFAIASEFNRYNLQPKIRVVDAAAGELRFAAAFNADDPKSLVDVLAKDDRLKIERRGDQEIVILSK